MKLKWKKYDFKNCHSALQSLEERKPPPPTKKFLQYLQYIESHFLTVRHKTKTLCDVCLIGFGGFDNN